MLLSQATLALVALSSVALALNDSPELTKRSLTKAQKAKVAAKKKASSLSSVAAHKASVSKAKAKASSLSKAKASKSKTTTSKAATSTSGTKIKGNQPGCFPTSVAYSPVFNFRQTSTEGCIAWCESQGDFLFVGMDLFDQDGSPSETPSCYCLADKTAKLTAPVASSECGAEWGSVERGFVSVVATV